MGTQLTYMKVPPYTPAGPNGTLPAIDWYHAVAFPNVSHGASDVYRTWPIGGHTVKTCAEGRKLLANQGLGANDIIKSVVAHETWFFG
jgi:hypothetical protein